MFTYILRFTIQPGHYEHERFDRLLKFCVNSKIDDVMFFVECEELNQGHVTRERLQPWLDMLARFKTKLNENGISLSINPWTTLVHGDRGRVLSKGQENIGLMCDRNGRYATVQACPISPGWRAYITDIYAAYAHLEPRMLWIEDDFRYHNHLPLDWGGCFCDEHMKLFSEMAGETVTREAFVQGMLMPGEPHRYREIWLKACRETTLENARLITSAVHAVSPNTQMGLMCGKSEVHSAEGVDWTALMEALRGERAEPCAVRPHLPMYREYSPQLYQWNFQEITALTRPNTGEEPEYYPELDNGPFSTFSVSRNMTKLKLLSSALVESKGITLSLFNMIGTGVMYEKQYEELLSAYKPLLEKVGGFNLRIGECEGEGVSMLVDYRSSYTLKTRKGEDITELYPSFGFFKSLLSGFGIAAAYTRDKRVSGRVVGVCGQQLRNMTHTEIEGLFANNRVLLDGESAEILLEYGLGRLIYAESGRWLAMDSGVQTYEEVAPDIIVDGVPAGRFSSQAYCADYFSIEYSENAPVTPLTYQKGPAGNTSGNGQVILGGRHYMFPYGHYERETLLHQDPVQQAVMLRAFGEWGVPHVDACSNLVLQCYRHEGQMIFLMLNFSDDPVTDIRLFAPEGGNIGEDAQICDAANPGGVPIKLGNDGKYNVLTGYTLAPFELAVLVC